MRLRLSFIGAALIIAAYVGSGFSRTAGVAAAQVPSPVLVASLRSADMMAIIDPVARKIIGRVPTGDDPHGVAISQDGRLAFVVCLMGDSISVIDVAARKELRRISVPGSHPHDIQFAAGKVYFTAEGYKAIGRYDPATQRLDFFGVGQDGPHMLAVTRAGTTIMSANRLSQNISVIEGAGPPEWKVRVISTGKRGEGVDITPDGRELWIGNRDGGGVSVVNLASGKVATHLDTQTKDASRLKITPDGKRVLVSDYESHVMVVVDVASRTVTRRFSIAAGALAVTQDSAHAYMAGAADYVTVLDLKTLEVAGRIGVGTDVHAVAWAAGK